MEEKLREKNYIQKIFPLMYHRIDRVDTNPWGICVSPENFEKQIRFLQSNFPVISINDLFNCLTYGNIETNTICITFDDGYADNLIYAKPVLEKYNCPATFFIATAFIDQPFFWWDELEIILLHSKYLPQQLALVTAGETERFIITETELSPQQWMQHKRWKWYQEPPTSRCKIYLSIWEKLRDMDFCKIAEVINKIQDWAGYEVKKTTQRSPINTQQLRELTTGNLFTTGMHTHTHCDLSHKNKSMQLDEISLCKKILLEKFGVQNNFLSYPFGRYNDETLQVANELQLNGCFTTEAHAVIKNTNKNVFGRYQVSNCNDTAFEKQIRKWFNAPRQIV